jgi:alcohol dehydrogenase class IV
MIEKVSSCDQNLLPHLKEPGYLPARRALMKASMFGVSLMHIAAPPQHSIGYPITSEFGIAHGLAMHVYAANDGFHLLPSRKN